MADAAEPAAVTPGLVRALAAAGAAIVEVRPAATSLESVYFEVMGVQPGAGEPLARSTVTADPG